MSKNDVVEIVALHVSRHGKPNHDEPEGSTVKDVYQCPCGKSTSTVIIYDWPGNFEVDKTMDCESCVGQRVVVQSVERQNVAESLVKLNHPRSSR